MPRPSRALLALVLLVAAAAMTGAALRSSTTFDEIVLVAAGARGVATGRWDLATDQPPLMPGLYGVPVVAAGAELPPETGEAWDYDGRWRYARALFWGSGNDPVRVALAARLVGIALALALILAVWAFTRSVAGEGAALLAAALTAFLPDVLAHGAVAYNDLPMALAFFLAVWALDAAVRAPGPGRGALAGLAVAGAFGVKYSALALGPVAVALLAAEAGARGRDRAWWRATAGAAAAGVAAFYLANVALYGLDPALAGLRYGFWMTVLHASEGHPAPAWLLGRSSATGWWWYFPVSFLLKTPAAFHLLGVAALVAYLRGDHHLDRALLRSRLRGPVVGLLVFGLFLLRARLNIGFRYALPALPLVAVLVAVGAARLWQGSGGRVRLGLALLVLLHVGSTLHVYPWFLAYTSEWAGPPRAAWRVVGDSSLDWGQGLLELRRWMEEEGVEAVNLGYFGSAPPEGYGIRYVALPSFLALRPERTAPPGARPAWTVVSATHLPGTYFPGEDPYAAYRGRTPERVLAGSLHVYREEGAPEVSGAGEAEGVGGEGPTGGDPASDRPEASP